MVLNCLDAFDARFWGPAIAAQKAQIRSDGSITFTIGKSPPPPSDSV